MRNRTGFFVLIVTAVGFLFSFLYSCSSSEPLVTETPTTITTSESPTPIITPQAMPTNNPHSNASVVAISKEGVDARQKIVQEWMDKASTIVKATQDEEARAVLEFLQHNHVGCLPEKDRIDCGRAAPLRIVPLLLSDAKVSDIWQSYITSKDIGKYEPSQQGIVLKAFIDVGDLYKALILLHEGKHALLDFQNPGHTSDYNVKIMEEIAIRSYIHRLELKVGGTQYQTLIEDRMRAKIPEFLRTGLVSIQLAYSPELDTIFGPAQSQEEKGLRQEELEIAAIFLLFERQDPLKSSTLKFGFMANVMKLGE